VLDAGTGVLLIDTTVAKINIHILDRAVRQDAGLFELFGKGMSVVGIVRKAFGTEDP